MNSWKESICRLIVVVKTRRYFSKVILAARLRGKRRKGTKKTECIATGQLVGFCSHALPQLRLPCFAPSTLRSSSWGHERKLELWSRDLHDLGYRKMEVLVPYVREGMTF